MAIEPNEKAALTDQEAAMRLVRYCVNGATNEQLQTLSADLLALTGSAPQNYVSSAMQTALTLASGADFCARFSSCLARDIAKMPNERRGKWFETLGPVDLSDRGARQVYKQLRCQLQATIAMEEAAQINRTIGSANPSKRTGL